MKEDDIKTHYLKAETSLRATISCLHPPRLGSSMQIGHRPTFSVPFPLTKRGVYRSSGERGGLYVPPGCWTLNSVHGDLEGLELSVK